MPSRPRAVANRSARSATSAKVASVDSAAGPVMVTTRLSP